MYDVAIAGGGTAGCALAARLSEDPSRTVCLVEAGPDYGPFEGGRWPADLLDARALALSHSWETDREDRSQLRARVIGGCSAHNACIVLRPPPEDYEAWGPGWSHAEVAPFLDRAEAVFAPRPFAGEEVSPWHRAFADAAGDDAIVHTANVRGATRWNAGFAYLDPARSRANLTIRAQTLVDRVLVEGGRSVGLATEGGEVRARTVVVAAGAYGSPAILLRSGLDPALPVGLGLQDHVGVGLGFESTAVLQGEAARFAAEYPVFMAQVTIRARSSRCEPGLWDVFHIAALEEGADGRFEASAATFVMRPRSRGSVQARVRGSAHAARRRPRPPRRPGRRRGARGGDCPRPRTRRERGDRAPGRTGSAARGRGLAGGARPRGRARVLPPHRDLRDRLGRRRRVPRARGRRPLRRGRVRDARGAAREHEPRDGGGRRARRRRARRRERLKPRSEYDRRVAAPDAIHFTGDPDADALLARDSLALLIGFALDQQITVQSAFSGPLRIQQRLGTLDPGTIAATDPGRLEEIFRERPAIHRFPGSMAKRVQALCALVADEYDGDASRLWTEAKDAKDLEQRIRALPGFGDMKVLALSAVLWKRLGVEVARPLAPDFPTLGDVDSVEALEAYQAAKRAYKKARRAEVTKT